MKSNLLFFFASLCASSLLLAKPPSGPSPEKPMRRGPPAVDRYIRQLEDQDPEEGERLRELRRTDPEAFRQELRHRAHQHRRDAPRGRAERAADFQEQLEQIQNAATPEEREAAVQKLREAVANRIDRGLDAREAALQRMRTKLAELETRHEQEKAERDALIDQQMERILE